MNKRQDDENIMVCPIPYGDHKNNYIIYEIDFQNNCAVIETKILGLVVLVSLIETCF